MYLIKWVEALVHIGYVEHYKLLEYGQTREYAKLIDELKADEDVEEITMYHIGSAYSLKGVQS